MLFSFTVIAAALFAEHVAAAKDIQTSVSKRSAIQAPSANSVSSNVLALTKRSSARGYNPRSAAWLLNKKSSAASSNALAIGKSDNLTSLAGGSEFATTVFFGTEAFDVIVDTGSSDTWLTETGFQCVSIEQSSPQPEAECAFGPTYNVSDTFKQIPNENFNITYGDGEFLTGIEGLENVTVAGLSVNQQVALVNYAAWQGDGTTSGLMGLAYPALTSAFKGTDAAADSSASQVVYSPIISTLVNQSLIAPLFSLAIDRDVSGSSGYLALGGTPPVDYTDEFTSTSILVTNIGGYEKSYDFYTINIDALVLDGYTLSGAGGSDVQYIVDSGTTLAYLPTPYSDLINSAFFPPAFYDEDEGAYIVDCGAQAPDFGIKINGTTFTINPLDMIVVGGEDEDGNVVCISGVTDGGDSKEDLFILGDTFQHNVVTVFDVGAAELRFAAREDYTSNDPVKA